VPLRLVAFKRALNIITGLYHFFPIFVFPQRNKNGRAYKKLMEVFQANFLGAIGTWGNFAEGRWEGESGCDLLERVASQGEKGRVGWGCR
jgi:hypothetical protein